LKNRVSPVLCYVTDRHALSGGATPENLVTRIAVAIDAGVDWVQVRERDLPARALGEIVRAAVRISSERFVRHPENPRVRIIVNDRLDIAVAAGADGVHLGGTSLPVSEINKMRGNGVLSEAFLIGASCHSAEGAQAAEREGADYVFFGPIFETPAKIRFGKPQGTDRLREVASSVSISVIAIGGITIGNAADCIAAGAAGIAAIRLFQEAEDLRRTVARLRGTG
jgi:thiamine-phosphate pyrophosphorylase